MKTICLAIATSTLAATAAHADCELKKPTHAHAEASTNSPVFDEVIPAGIPVSIRFEKNGWDYVDVQRYFKDLNNYFKDAVGWAFVRGGWVRSDQVKCLE